MLTTASYILYLKQHSLPRGQVWPRMSLLDFIDRIHCQEHRWQYKLTVKSKSSRNDLYSLYHFVIYISTTHSNAKDNSYSVTVFYDLHHIELQSSAS